MNKLALLLLPAAGLLISACASGPYAGGGYGPGPNPRDGYYWNGTVYVQGDSPWRHGDRDDRNVNDVDVNHTTVNDRTVNNTTVNDRSVNRTSVNKTNTNRGAGENRNTASNKTPHKHIQSNDKGGNAKPTPAPNL